MTVGGLERPSVRSVDSAQLRLPPRLHAWPFALGLRLIAVGHILCALTNVLLVKLLLLPLEQRLKALLLLEKSLLGCLLLLQSAPRCSEGGGD